MNRENYVLDIIYTYIYILYIILIFFRFIEPTIYIYFLSFFVHSSFCVCNFLFASFLMLFNIVFRIALYSKRNVEFFSKLIIRTSVSSKRVKGIVIYFYRSKWKRSEPFLVLSRGHPLQTFRESKGQKIMFIT